jgi:osmoprotectant transport system permease protein
MKLVCAFLIAAAASTFGEDTIAIGSKNFTESYVLGEIAKRTLIDAGIPAEHRAGMGGTIILWQALRTGQISAYPEYTGTIVEEILQDRQLASPAQLRDALAKFDVAMTEPLGFNNTYALAMRRESAQKFGIRTISDLRNHPELKIGLTHEFLNREDGWRPLAAKYQLNPRSVIGIEHALAYAAVKNGSLDVTDAYSTDAKIAEFDLVALDDDQKFFPRYDAVFLYRSALPERTIAAVRKLEGTLDESRMTKLNAAAEETKNYARAAALYFDADARSTKWLGESLVHRIGRWTLRHLELSGVSLLLAIIVGIPLGIAASRGGTLGHAILAFSSIVQTIPSLALLALLVPLPFFGISPRTAIAALFLYGLLPIVRNTATGLQDIAQPIRDSAIALGLESGARLRKIYLPMASRSILGGIKTSAVINVGTATLAALIGAGGLGEPILSGLNLNDHATILQGAIPAAVLALLVQWTFDLLDRVLIPKGLRL